MFSGFIFRIVQITTPLYLWLIKFCVLDVTNAISIHPLTGTLFSSFEATMNIQVQVLPMARERAQQVIPDTLSLTPGTLIKQACVVLSSVMPALLQETGDSVEVHTGRAAQEQRGWGRSCIDMGEGQNQLPKPVQPHTHTTVSLSKTLVSFERLFSILWGLPGSGGNPISLFHVEAEAVHSLSPLTECGGLNVLLP